jgi:hypothetical protein
VRWILRREGRLPPNGGAAANRRAPRLLPGQSCSAAFAGETRGKMARIGNYMDA